MADTVSRSQDQAPSPMMVVFDAPDDLKHAFLEAGFQAHGRQPGAWHLRIDPASELARDLEYELKGVGLLAKWWSPTGGRRLPLT